jgi:uncharacterized UBP type Zn finger protein
LHPGNAVLRELTRLLKCNNVKPNNVTHVGKLRTVVRSDTLNFANEQHDVSEFFMCLLNLLPMEMQQYFAFRTTDFITCLSCNQVSRPSNIMSFVLEKKSSSAE